MDFILLAVTKCVFKHAMSLSRLKWGSKSHAQAHHFAIREIATDSFIHSSINSIYIAYWHKFDCLKVQNFKLLTQLTGISEQQSLWLPRWNHLRCINFIHNEPFCSWHWNFPGKINGFILSSDGMPHMPFEKLMFGFWLLAIQIEMLVFIGIHNLQAKPIEVH